MNGEIYIWICDKLQEKKTSLTSRHYYYRFSISHDNGTLEIKYHKVISNHMDKEINLTLKQ